VTRIKPTLLSASVLYLIANWGVVSGATLKPISIQFVNKAADIPGFWDESVRSDFVEAMNIAAANVSSKWLGGRPVIVSSDIRSNWRLIVVDHPLNFDGTPATGFHDEDGTGPYAIFTLGSSGSVAGIFLDASHELEEMLVDPSANRFINGWYAEVADPVVCCHYEVTLSDGTVQPLNDFVLPHWFDPREHGPYDFINSQYVTHALEPGPDGFRQHDR
jgi:hypothetical protein